MGDKNVTIKTVADLQNAYPELCTSMVQDAVDQERKRMRALDDIANAVPEEMLAKAKTKNQKMQKKQHMKLSWQKKRQVQTLWIVCRKDAKNSGAGKVTPAPKDIQDDESKKSKTEEDHKKRVNKLTAAFENVQKKGGK